MRWSAKQSASPRDTRFAAGLAICDATRREGPYDKTELLLIGQRLAPISLVHDETTVTVAARFDSGIDLVSALGLNGRDADPGERGRQETR